MSDIAGTVDTTPAAPPPDAPVSDEAELGAVFDKLVRDNGAERDNGQFVSPDPAKRVETPAGEVDAKPADAGEAGAEELAPPAISDVPLPANWTGMEEVWAKVPAEARADIAAHAQKLHATLSDQGRQLSNYRPIGDIINEYADYFDGRVKDPDTGQTITPANGVKYLFGMQRAMDQNPVQTLLMIADSYKARDALTAVLGGKADPAQFQRQQAPQTPAGLSPAQVEALVADAVEKKTAEQTTGQLLKSFAADKPHYKAVEADLPDFITLARRKLGDDAAPAALLDTAYDMAVHANPDLRGKVTAAPKIIDAVANDPKKTEAAKRANAVNVTSTSSGKTRTLTDDEELGNAYDKAKAS